jgi:membrane protein DedA with SNARE-associated domain/membrane-associated phospholipid phosphatase
VRVSGLVETLLGLASPWGYVLVGLLAAGEAAAFAGLVIPGETAMLLGGVLAASGRAELAWMIAAGILGAAVGDSIGYEVGRRFGGPLRRSRLGRRIGEQRWQRAEDYVRRRGGLAVFLGRWTSVLRALVPFVTGASRLPYRVFLPCNVAGGMLWATTYILLGYFAGSSYQRVERVAGRASLILTGLLILVVLVVLGARWVSRHQDATLAVVRRITHSALAQRIADRYSRRLSIAAARLRPGGAFGLALAAQLAVLVVAGAVFGWLTESLLRGHDLIGPDSPVARFLEHRREPWLTTTMHGISWLSSPTVLIPVAAVVGVLAARRDASGRPLVFLTVALAGSAVLVQLVRLLVVRTRPDVPAALVAHAFPSGHATAAAAGWAAIAVVLFRHTTHWRPRVVVATGALLIALLVGISRVYLGADEPTDVAGGWALGTAWVAGVAAAGRAWSQPATGSWPDAHLGRPVRPHRR